MAATRLPHPWILQARNTGVGCHCLLQCMKVKSESEATQSCPTLRDPTDCSLPGSSIHGIFQARVLEWGAIAFSAYGQYHVLFLSLRLTSVSVIISKFICRLLQVALCSFYGWVISSYKCTASSLCTLRGWVFRLLPRLSYRECCCSGRQGALSLPVTLVCRYTPRSGVAESYVSSIFNFLKKPPFCSS